MVTAAAILLLIILWIRKEQGNASRWTLCALVRQSRCLTITVDMARSVGMRA